MHWQLCEMGSLIASRSHSGCVKTNERIAVDEVILDVVVDQPIISTWVIAKQLHASISLTWRILKDGRLHPFYIQRVKALTEQNYPRQVEFSRWFLQKNVINPDFGATVLFTDICTFTHEDAFNFHKQHAWAENKLQLFTWSLAAFFCLSLRRNNQRQTTRAARTSWREKIPHFFAISAARHIEQCSLTHPASNMVLAKWSINSLHTRRAQQSGSFDLIFCWQLKFLMHKTPIESAKDLVARLTADAGEVKHVWCFL